MSLKNVIILLQICQQHSKSLRKTEPKINYQEKYELFYSLTN